MSAAATRCAVDIEVASLEVGVLDILPFAGRCMLDYDPKEYTKS